MIYEFKSRATGSVVMTSEVAEALLHIIGKQKGPQGIIVPDAMLAAIDALNNAIAVQKSAEGSNDKADDDEGIPKISLAQRALPLIEMMQRAHSAVRDYLGRLSGSVLTADQAAALIQDRWTVATAGFVGAGRCRSSHQRIRETLSCTFAA